jgi:hypothetical protein
VSFTRHSLTGTLELTDGSRVDLDIKDGRVALEEARSPYSQIDVTTSLPESAVLERIDPRSALRAQFTTRSDYGQGSLASEFTQTFTGYTIPTTYAWTGTADASVSTETVNGVETRRNLYPFPSFESSSLSPYLNSGCAVAFVTNWSTNRARSIRLTPNTTSNGSSLRIGAPGTMSFGVIAGRTYTLSGNVYTPVAQSGTLHASARKIVIAIGGGTLVSFESPAGPVVGAARVSVTFTIPADATSFVATLWNGAGNAAANHVQWDGILLEETGTLKPYFDGATPSFTTPRPTTAADVTAVYGGLTAAAVSADYFYAWNSFGVRSPTIRNYNLSLRSFEADHRAGELRLVFNSDEMLMQDFALLSKDSIAPLTSTVKGAVNLALSKVNAALSPDSLDALVDDVESLVWKPGVSAWDYVEPLVQKAGLRLYCDEQRIWRLTEPQRSVDGFLSLAASSNVTRGIDSVSLDARSEDSFYDGVVVRYEWQDALNVRQTAYDVAGDPASARKVYSFTISDVPYPGPGAATAILRRSQGRGRVLNVDAISDYSTEPGLPLGISLPNSITQTGYVSAVDWEFPEGTMSVKSRGLVETPPDSWTLTPPELVWSSVADDTTWANFPNIPISGGA